MGATGLQENKTQPMTSSFEEEEPKIDKHGLVDLAKSWKYHVPRCKIFETKQPYGLFFITWHREVVVEY